MQRMIQNIVMQWRCCRLKGLLSAEEYASAYGSRGEDIDGRAPLSYCPSPLAYLDIRDHINTDGKESALERRPLRPLITFSTMVTQIGA